MATKAMYFFCKQCGGDSAAYEMYHACPYCRAKRPDFELIGQTGLTDEKGDIMELLQSKRTEWIKTHKRVHIGIPVRPRGLRKLLKLGS